MMSGFIGRQLEFGKLLDRVFETVENTDIRALEKPLVDTIETLKYAYRVSIDEKLSRSRALMIETPGSMVNRFVASKIICRLSVFLKHRDSLSRLLTNADCMPSKKDFKNAISSSAKMSGCQNRSSMRVDDIAYRCMRKIISVIDTEPENMDFAASVLMACATSNDVKELRDKLLVYDINQPDDVMIQLSHEVETCEPCQPSIPLSKRPLRLKATKMSRYTKVKCIEAACVFGNTPLVESLLMSGSCGINSNICKFMACGGVMPEVVVLMHEPLTNENNLRFLGECVRYGRMFNQSTFVARVTEQLNAGQRKYIKEYPSCLFENRAGT